MRVNDPKAKTFILNNEIGQFVTIPDVILFSPGTEGIFQFSKKFVGNAQLTSYRAASVKRFSIILCVLNQKLWRMLARDVCTQYEGVLCFKMHKTMYRDINGRYNLVGVKTESEAVKFEIRFNTSDNGITMNEFGYAGNITYNRVVDKVLISTNLEPENATRRLFPIELYENSGRHVPVSSIRDQHVAAERDHVIAKFTRNDAVGTVLFFWINISKSLSPFHFPQDETNSETDGTSEDDDVQIVDSSQIAGQSNVVDASENLQPGEADNVSASGKSPENEVKTIPSDSSDDEPMVIVTK